MAQRTQLDDSNHPLHEAYACLIANGLDGAGEALRILVNEAPRIAERVNDFATPGFMNLRCRIEVFVGWSSPMVVG